MLYYGDEIGMEGGPDPDNRRPMIWEPEQQDQELLAHYRHLIALRHKHVALRTDGVWTCLAQDETSVYAYLRGKLVMGDAQPSDEVVLVVLNNSEASHYIEVPLQIPERGEKACWADGTAVRDELSGRVYRVEKGMVRLELGAYEGAVISKFN